MEAAPAVIAIFKDLLAGEVAQAVGPKETVIAVLVEAILALILHPKLNFLL